jgi:fluoride exporter
VRGLVIVVLICIAGGIGSALRFILDGMIRRLTQGTYPVGTTAINITGSLLLGLVTGLASRQLLPPPWQLVVGAGLLGGYTTFSTASFETVRLLEDRRWAAAAVNGFGQLVAGTAAAALGYAAAFVLVP